MSEPTSLSIEEKDDIVAYLDGELDEAGVTKVERLLVANAAARREAELYARTFELLDALPHPAVSREFTARTLSAIEVHRVPATRTGLRLSRRMRRGAVTAGWVSALTVAALFGFLATNRWAPDESEALIRDLPVIENLDRYADVETIDYLQQLQQSGLFHESERFHEP